MALSGEQTNVLYVAGETAAERTAELSQLEEDATTVNISSSAADAIEALADGRHDCVVSAYELPDRTGVELLDSVRERHPDLPFVLYPENGDERIASDAVSAGVTEYLPNDDGADLSDAVGAAIATQADGHGDRPHRRRFETILQTNPACVVELDADGRFVYANARAKDILGLERAEVTDRKYNDPEWHIRDLADNPIPDAELPFQRVLNTGEPLYGAQHKIRWPDGSERVLQVNGAPLSDDRGAVTGAVFSLIDITEKKRREREITEMNTVLQTMVENLPMGVVVENADRDILLANDRLGDLFDSDVSREALIGRDCERVAAELKGQFADPDGFVAGIEERIEQREPVRNERLRLADGRVLERDYVPYLLAGSQANLWLYRDVTDRTERETRLEMAQRIIEHSADIATIIDSDGTITYVSPAVERVLGYDADELVGANGFEYQPPETQATVAEGLEHVLNNPSAARTVRTRFRAADDSWRWIESTLRNYTDDDVIDGVLVNSRDITERKQYEQQLETQRDDLTLLHQILRHDIRNDLQVITGRGDILADHVDDDGDRHLQTVLAAAAHAVELTDTARDLSALIMSTGNVEGTSVPLRPTLQDELDDVRSGYPEAEISVDGSVPAVQVRANEMLDSVFRNLLINAIQHNDAAVPRITVSTGVASDRAVIRIADNGPGVPDELKSDVFEEQKKGADSAGSGLGLYFVRRLVTHYGGTVEVVDNEPTGAVFVVELPIAE